MNTTIEQKKNSISIASIFNQMTDQRKPRGVRYLFESLLILLSLAKLCNQDTPSEIADWVQNRSELLKKKLGLDWKRMPSQSTWQRLIGANIDAAEFDWKVGEYFGALSPEERELLNLDGKVLCSTVDKETDEQLHLLALQKQKANLVVEQTEIEQGENEISGAKRLLRAAHLENKIVSGDAIFAQKELSKIVVEGGGELYVKK